MQPHPTDPPRNANGHPFNKMAGRGKLNDNPKLSGDRALSIAVFGGKSFVRQVCVMLSRIGASL